MTIASAALAAAPSLPPVAVRALADAGNAQNTGFAAQLAGLTSSRDLEIPTLSPPVPVPAAPRRLGTAAKDPKKDNDTQGLTVAVVAAPANPVVLPLQFQFPSRDASDSQHSDPRAAAPAPTPGPSPSPTKDKHEFLASDTHGPTISMPLPAANAVVQAMQFQSAADAGDHGQQGDPTDVQSQAKANPPAPANIAEWQTRMQAGQDTPAAASTAPTVAPPASAAIAPDPTKPDMAFAVRVQPTTPTRPASEPQQAAASASALRKASIPDPADNKDAARPVEPAAALRQVAAAFEQTSRATDTPAPQRITAAQPAPEPAATPLDAHPQPAAPLKDISFHVTQPGSEKVEVRVVQQSGEVHVAVRTGDTDLAHGLRQGLPELVGKLEDSGYRADTWRPGGSTSSAPTTPLAQSQEPQSASGQSQNGDPSGRQNGSQQNGGQQNQNAFNRPRWVEELESSFAGTGESTGEPHGIGS